MSLFAEQSPADAAEAQVLNLMKSYTSNIMGTARTYWQFLYGFSMSFSIFCFAAGVLSPMVSRALDWHAPRRVAAFNACWLAAMTLSVGKVFFYGPDGDGRRRRGAVWAGLVANWPVLGALTQVFR